MIRYFNQALNFRKVLWTLDETRTDAKAMKASIKTINQEYEVARTRAAELLTELTVKATVLEKIKAKYGIANALSAFLLLNELSDTEEETDDLLKEGELFNIPNGINIVKL